jgi:hypothetical protein
MAPSCGFPVSDERAAGDYFGVINDFSPDWHNTIVSGVPSVRSTYVSAGDHSAIRLRITNVDANQAEVSVLDA